MQRYTVFVVTSGQTISAFVVLGSNSDSAADFISVSMWSDCNEIPLYRRWTIRHRNHMAESVSSHGEVFALCGQAYQISILVILYVDLKRGWNDSCGVSGQNTKACLRNVSLCLLRFHLDQLNIWQFFFHLYLEWSMNWCWYFLPMLWITVSQYIPPPPKKKKNVNVYKVYEK